jgi:hypothetical protein
MKSWKTSLCGILSLLALGISSAPGLSPTLAHILVQVSIACGGLAALFARDNNVSSQSLGLPQTPSATVTTNTPGIQFTDDKTTKK